MQKYHPTRIITLTYQPFVLATTAIFTYHEAKVNTRVRNLAGYTLFFLSSFGVIIVSLLITAYKHITHAWSSLICSCPDIAGCFVFRKWWNRPIRWYLYHCCCFWHSRRSCSRRNDWWSVPDVPRIRPGAVLYNHRRNSELQETFVHNLFDVNLLPRCSVCFGSGFSVLLWRRCCIRCNNRGVKVLHKSGVWEFQRWPAERS